MSANDEPIANPMIAVDRDRPARIGLTIAVLGWLIGSIIGIAVNHSVVSLNLS